MLTLATPLLELRGISKRFPGVLALDHVSLSLYPGEVHMLMGENEADKSTLMKVLCGAYQANAGQFFAGGELVEVRTAADATALGVAVIFQEYSLVPHLSIGQNIYLGRELLTRLGLVDHARLYRDARAVLAGEATPDRLVTPMVGCKVDMSYHRGTRPVPGECLLDVDCISAFESLNFCPSRHCKKVPYFSGAA